MAARNLNRLVISRLAMIVFIFGGLLFGSAGTFSWPEAWLFLIIYLAWAIPAVTWLKKNNPELLKERLAFFKKPAKGWDNHLHLLYPSCTLTLCPHPSLNHGDHYGYPYPF